MISLCNTLPVITLPSAELVKLHCNLDCYPDIGLFWVQDDEKCYIGMLDGNMIIYNINADTDELCEFISVLSPCCIFSDIDTLRAVGREPEEPICVMGRSADIKTELVSDRLSSREIYNLLDVDGLSLPDYEYFAVDFCRRINHGFADYYAEKGRCATISLNTGDYAIINGIASHQKGLGSRALSAILSKNFGRTFLACCRESVRGFYEKNGFKLLYYSGYWVKK